jgi:Fic family protein
MRKPDPPPPQDELWREFGEKAPELLAAVPEALVAGKYVHWDKLRHLKPPSGLSHRAWWFALKIRRVTPTRLPLVDPSGRPFGFNVLDPLLECLHRVDSLACGAIHQPEPVTNPETRDSYLVRSLIEESITSSQLEGASTTREVAKEMIRTGRTPRDRNERMIFNNYRTMQNIIEIQNADLDRDLVFEIHRMVTDGTFDDPSAVGRFRGAGENIIVGDPYGEVLHIPPPAEELEGRMAAMCDFANALTLAGFMHPLVRSMILHFWLAYDHPFVDGNGRTARALFYWSMLKRGYRLFEYVTISRIILKSPVQYGRAFLESETDGNDLTYFLLYHADVVRRAIDELYHYIGRRTAQLAALEQEHRGLTFLNARQRDLISHALRHPGRHYTIESQRSSHNVVYETARSDMMDLVARGLLQKRKVGKVWIFTPSANLEQKLRQAE